MEDKIISIKELKKVFWNYIGKHGIVVNNGNIDYIVEQALKEYEDLEEQGLIVRLPCKVGDKVFGIVDTFAYNNTIRELKIMGLAYIVEDENKDLTFQNVERIFKTEAEAEKKLAELKGEE